MYICIYVETDICPDPDLNRPDPDLNLNPDLNRPDPDLDPNRPDPGLDPNRPDLNLTCLTASTVEGGAFLA